MGTIMYNDVSYDGGASGGTEIDDTTTASDKVWSSQKTNTEIANSAYTLPTASGITKGGVKIDTNRFKIDNDEVLKFMPSNEVVALSIYSSGTQLYAQNIAPVAYKLDLSAYRTKVNAGKFVRNIYYSYNNAKIAVVGWTNFSEEPSTNTAVIYVYLLNIDSTQISAPSDLNLIWA